MRFNTILAALAVFSLIGCDGIGSPKPTYVDVAQVYNDAWGKRLSPANMRDLECAKLHKGVWHCNFTLTIPPGRYQIARDEKKTVRLKKTSSGWLYVG